MLWAVGSDHNFGYHAQRGQFQANLLQAPEEPASTEGLSSVELRMPNVTVVMGEGGSDPTNPYICTYLDLEEIAAKEGFSVKDVSSSLLQVIICSMLVVIKPLRHFDMCFDTEYSCNSILSQTERRIKTLCPPHDLICM